MRHTEHPTHRRIFSDAFHIAWTHKHLWLFGLMAMLAGFGGATDAFVGTYDRPMRHMDMGAIFAAEMSSIEITTYPALFAYLAMYAGFAMLLIWVTFTAIGGLVANIRSISRGGEPTIMDGIDEGKKHFWGVFGVNLATRLIALTASGLIAAAISTLLAERTALSALFYLGTFILFVAISVMASMCGAFATIDIMAKKRTVVQAVEEGFVVVARHWLLCLETALLLALALIALLTAAALAVAMASVPVIFMIVLFSLAKVQGAVLGLMVLTAFLLLAVFCLIISFFGTFQAAVWTLLWHELAEGRGSPKLHRMFRHLHHGSHK